MAQASIRDIVVVDDDTAVLESYQFMLELAGFRVAAFTSAIAFLEEPDRGPSCMILDQHMPLMTGLQLVERLQELNRLMPIMLVTAAPSPAIRQRAAELGVSRVLEKPPNERDVLDFVTAYA